MKFKKAAASASAVLLVTLMTAAAELLGNREILFPEIAAIAVGYLICPRPAWKTDSRRIFLMITAGAVLGVLVVRFLPLPQWAKMSAAFLCASLLLAYSRTGFAPVISAVVLPVMLGTESAVYPVSAVCLTLLILGVRALLDCMKITEPSAFQPLPLPDKHALTELLLRWFIGSVIIVLALQTGLRFAAAPPLLVAFTEFCKPESPAQKHPLRLLLMLSSCAAAGSLMRLGAMHLNLPLFSAAFCTILCVVILMQKTGIFLPPAAALSILAFLIPKEAVPVYPAQAALGALLMTGAALFIAHQKQRVRRADKLN